MNGYIRHWPQTDSAIQPAALVDCVMHFANSFPPICLLIKQNVIYWVVMKQCAFCSISLMNMTFLIAQQTRIERGDVKQVILYLRSKLPNKRLVTNY